MELYVNLNKKKQLYFQKSYKLLPSHRFIKVLHVLI